MSHATKQPSRKAYAPLKLILLVEDDTANATCITQIISQETPYHVFLATNSCRALEVVKHLKPQLFILDYRLPGMDGIKLYDQLHAITAQAAPGHGSRQPGRVSDRSADGVRPHGHNTDRRESGRQPAPHRSYWGQPPLLDPER